MKSAFHIAIPSADLDQSRIFYVQLLGCETARTGKDWTDFNLYGHQISVHRVDDFKAPCIANATMDGKTVPVPHFGVVLDWSTWHALSRRISDLHVEFLIKPYIRFAGLAGEQATFFIQDPSGHAWEFKAFQDAAQLFAG